MSKDAARRSPSELENWLNEHDAGGISVAAHGALGMLLGSVPGFVYRCRNAPGWPMEFVSERIESVLGYRSEDVLAPTCMWEDLIHPEDRRPVREAVARAVDEGQCFRLLYRLKNAQGEWRWCADAGAATKPHENRAILEGVIVDVTQERLLQRERMRRERAEIIGRLASRVAHDFNNILQGLAGIAAELDHTEDQRARALGHELSQAVLQGGALTRQLTESASRRRDGSVRTDVAETTRKLEPMLSRLLGDKVHLTVSSDGQPAEVRIEPIRFEQVLLNLATNARDAMGGSGVCTVRIRSDRSEGLAVLEFEDNGGGVPQRVRDRIFDEFFTTKPDGEGSGLGLAIVADVLQECGGSTAFDSRPGQGTTFTLRFPLAPSTDTASPQSQQG